jgi:hypothetical protein
MAYFKINGTDFSQYVNELKVKKSSNYNAQTNAAGDTVVDYINTKRQIEVGIITLNESDAQTILAAVEGFNVLISYRDPRTGALVENVNCIIPDTDVDYYTIQSNKVMLNDFKLKFTEL